MSHAEGKTCLKDLLNLRGVVKKVGEYVIFTYEEELFPEKIMELGESKVKISAMQRSLKS